MIKTCALCGSNDPHTTIGWPVCLNDYFHEPRRRGLAAYRYQPRHAKAIIAGTLTALALLLAPTTHAQPPPPNCTWIQGTPPPPQHQCPILNVPGFPMPVFNFGFFPPMTPLAP